MGVRYYESTGPKIADELARLHKNLEALIGELRTVVPRGPEAARPPAARDSGEHDEPR